MARVQKSIGSTWRGIENQKSFARRLIDRIIRRTRIKPKSHTLHYAVSDGKASFIYRSIYRTLIRSACGGQRVRTFDPDGSSVFGNSCDAIGPYTKSIFPCLFCNFWKTRAPGHVDTDISMLIYRQCDQSKRTSRSILISTHHTPGGSAKK